MMRGGYRMTVVVILTSLEVIRDFVYSLFKYRKFSGCSGVPQMFVYFTTFNKGTRQV